MNLSICAPNRQFRNEFSCFSLDSLKKIATAYNKKIKRNDIEISDDIHDLHKQISKSLSKICTNESCWAEQTFVKNINDEKINHYTFKPIRPKGKTTWLSTSDIRKVMKQFEKKFKDFVFLGPVPIDFDDIYTEIADINFNELIKNKKTKMGIIFNLDEHYKSGSHWVASYAEWSNNLSEISYYDSYGHIPNKRIITLMNRLVKKAKKDINKNLEIKINKHRMQYKNSECGPYSMNYILHRVMGDSFEETCSNLIKDDVMNDRRNLFFRS